MRPAEQSQQEFLALTKVGLDSLYHLVSRYVSCITSYLDDDVCD